MLLSAVWDTTGELARCSGPQPATCPGPAQTQPQAARQAELVICDKAIERSFAWLSRYRRLNIVYDRAPDLFAAHVWVAMISIISRRLVAQTQAQ
jgi:transposase